MSHSITCLPPSKCLPKLRSKEPPTALLLQGGLRNLRAVYCPLRLPVASCVDKTASPAIVDSGYASEEDDEQSEHDEQLSILRADSFEREYAIRWLTNLISHAEALPLTEEEVSSAVDEAAFILASFSDAGDEEDEEPLCRDFSFPATGVSGSARTIDVQLKDVPLSGTDHTDVGLQSWGASIILSGLLCAEPDRFNLRSLPAGAKIVELGAGTGLVSLTLAQLIPYLTAASPTIFATDYHPAVLENLGANIAMNHLHPDSCDALIQTATLDWMAPPLSLNASADMVIAADVVYAPEHAAWLRDCAKSILAPDGIFWLIATIRSNGKFEGISDTVEAAFRERDLQQPMRHPTLEILHMEHLVKKRGIGRGDEDGYKLFKIGWRRV